MVTHLEPDILEREVKWALRSMTTNKASGGDKIPAELFQILNDDAVKVLKERRYQRIFKLSQTAFFSRASKVMLKILQARLP